MSQKTGDSFAMHSIFYSNEMGGCDIVLCLSAVHVRARTHNHGSALKRMGRHVCVCVCV